MRRAKRNRDARRASGAMACAAGVCLRRRGPLAGAPDAAVAGDRRSDRARGGDGAHLGRGPSRKGARGHSVGAVPDHETSSLCRVCDRRARRGCCVGTDLALRSSSEVIWPLRFSRRCGTRRETCGRGSGTDTTHICESRTAQVKRAFSLRRAMSVNKEYKAIAGLVAFALIMAAKVLID